MIPCCPTAYIFVVNSFIHFSLYLCTWDKAVVPFCHNGYIELTHVPIQAISANGLMRQQDWIAIISLTHLIQKNRQWFTIVCQVPSWMKLWNFVAQVFPYHQVNRYLALLSISLSLSISAHKINWKIEQKHLIFIYYLVLSSSFHEMNN